MRPVEIFHIGPQKTATTWIYRCMMEHPELAGPPKDTVHYFDMAYHRGRDWYASHFTDAGPDQRLFDPTPSYIRSTWAPRRIAQENPAARVATCLRNPIDRAFSHYWHEKKKLHINLEFDRTLNVYDCYTNWLEPGFYAEHLERFLQVFPREQLLCQSYDQLQDEPRAFLRELFTFCQVDAEFVPSMLNRKINVAGESRTKSAQTQSRLRSTFRFLKHIPWLGDRLRKNPALSAKGEYVRGVPPELRATLTEICEPEIVRLERLLDLDLSHWRHPAAQTATGATLPHESRESAAAPR